MCFEGMSHANLTTSPHWEGGCHWKEKSQPFARQVGCFLMIFTVWQALVILIRGLLIPGMKCSIFLVVTNVDQCQEHPNDVQMLHPSHSSKHSASGHPHSWLATSGLDRAKVRPQPGLTEGEPWSCGPFLVGRLRSSFWKYLKIIYILVDEMQNFSPILVQFHLQ